jgi:peptidyl-tRNA hydrolase
VNKVMYILVRDDLPKSWRAPQACHAVAEVASAFGSESDYLDWLRNHRTMVVLATGEE